MGYYRAGFSEIVGIDLAPQPHYPFLFVQADAMNPPVRLSDFDAIHASPPCQRYSAGGRRFPEAQQRHPDLLRQTIDMLRASGVPFIVENVMGARALMPTAVMVCGRAMGLLRLARHRLFESSHLLLVPPCQCASATETTIGVYGDRPDGRLLNSRSPKARAAKGLPQAHAVMGMDWADWKGTKEAIPPCYTEYLGRQLIAVLERAA